MKNKFLAHISEDGREQTVFEHLAGAASLAAAFSRPFGGEAQGLLAGTAHDIGKYSAAFQRRLTGDSRRVDHATAGAFECMGRGQPFAAFAVAGHHGGLPDGGGRGDGPETATFWGRINRAGRGGLEPYGAWAREVSLPVGQPPPFAKQDLGTGMFFTRMLYSCLVDADFLDTETFMSGKPRAGGCAPMDVLWDKLQAHISGWFPPKNELNAQRCAILKNCIAQGEANAPGLFTLTVPTGGGKTVASLAFALAHARAHGLRRVIYVIPYTSIIEQTASVFREILGAENVLEHHSNVLYDMETEADPHTIRMAQATENWDMPVIVTTAVQFFESLYACRSSQCRKLHNLADSVIILDEAQMLPLPYLRPCVHAIAQLAGHYRASAVLCTATQPALNPLFGEFLPGAPIKELCPAGACRWEVFRRVTFQRAGRLRWDELARQMNRQVQALCIVNRRKSAQELFRMLEKEGSFHLTTLMYPAHRQSRLEEIRRRLKAGLPCRVVSTSLIEAGVDVDFPAVYREEAGLDSILQAAGRCNREGKRPVHESTVCIFQGEDMPPRLFATAIELGRAVLSRHEDISSPEAIHDYFHQLLEVQGPEAQDKKGILPRINREFFPFRTVAKDFQLIEAATRTIYIPQGEGALFAERLLAGERSRALYRMLGRYSVAVYEDHFRALEQAGALEPLEDGSFVLKDLDLYDADVGLSLRAEDKREYIL